MANNMKRPFASRTLPILAILFFVTLVNASAKGNKHGVKTAKSRGNDQDTFSMTIEPSSYPFCNITEANDPPLAKPPADRVVEAMKLPALLSPGACQQANAKWSLSADPSIHAPFRNDELQWLDAPDWNQLVSGVMTSQPAEQKFETSLATSVTTDNNKGTLSSVGDPNKPTIVGGSLLLVDEGPNQELVKVVSATDLDITIAGLGRNGAWLYDHAAQARVTVVVAKQSGACFAGAADVVLERTFRYGFCDKRFYRGLPPFNPINSTFRLTDSDYYILNVVVWKKQSKNESYLVSSSEWYVYNRGDHGKWYRQPLPKFDDPLRVYGTSKPIGLVAIHIRPDNVPWDDFKTLKASYTVTVKSKTAANISDFTTLLSLVSKSGASAAQKDPDGFYGAMFFKAKAPADITISSEVDFPKATSASLVVDPEPPDTLVQHGAPVSSLDGARLRQTGRAPTHLHPSRLQVGSSPEGLFTPVHLLLATSATEGNSRDAEDADIGGEGSASQTGSTSSPDQGTKTDTKSTDAQTTKKPTTTPEVAAAPTVDCQPNKDSTGKQSPCKFTASVDDEDLYHWDVSIGLPFRTINQLQFAQSSGNGNSLVTKSTTTLNAYAFFDIYPFAADIKSPPILPVPHLLVGLPISGKVFNKPLFGAAEGLSLKKISVLSFLPIQFQFFGGLVYNKEFRQIPGTTGSSNVYGHRVWSGTYGVDIPVSQFKDLFKSNKTSNATPTKSSTSPSQ